MLIRFLTKRFLVTIGVMFLGLLGIFASIYYFNPNDISSDKVVFVDNTNYSDEIKQTQNIVTVGVYPLNVYQIDTASNTFQMTAYVWMTWRGDDLQPNETLDIVNLVSTSSFTKTEITNQTLSDGREYYLMKIDGTFFKPFDMSDYPVDQQQLTLIFEDSIDTSDDVIYVPDVENTKSDQLIIPGYELKQIVYTASQNTYQSNLGYTDGLDATKVANLQFSIVIAHPLLFYFVKFAFPLTVILLCNYIVFWLPYAFIESKLYFITGTLLSLIFLQQQYIPKINGQQLVLIDYLYIFSYMSTFMTLISKLYFYRKIEGGWAESEAAMWDKMIFLGHFVVYMVMVLGIFWKYLQN